MAEVDVDALRAAIGRVRETMNLDYPKPLLVFEERDARRAVVYAITEAVRDLLPLLDGLPDRLARLERAAETGRAWRDQPEFGNVDHIFNAWAKALEEAGYGEAGEDGDG